MGRCLILFVCASTCLLSYASVASAEDSSGGNAQRAYVDPQTGKLATPPTRPQSQRAPETSAQRKVIAAPSRAYRRADGVLVLQLGPESRINERVELNKNGKLRRVGHE